MLQLIQSSFQRPSYCSSCVANMWAVAAHRCCMFDQTFLAKIACSGSSSSNCKKVALKSLVICRTMAGGHSWRQGGVDGMEAAVEAG